VIFITGVDIDGGRFGDFRGVGGVVGVDISIDPNEFSREDISGTSDEETEFLRLKENSLPEGVLGGGDERRGGFIAFGLITSDSVAFVWVYVYAACIGVRGG
jgi:hypothetical protein